MPRKPDPETRTASQRARDSRERRGARVMEIPGVVMAQIEAIRDRDGDASLVAVVARLVEQAA